MDGDPLGMRVRELAAMDEASLERLARVTEVLRLETEVRHMTSERRKFDAETREVQLKYVWVPVGVMTSVLVLVSGVIAGLIRLFGMVGGA